MDSFKYSSIGDYALVKTLGEGSGTKCKLGVHRDTKKEVAIKVMKRSSPEITSTFITLWKNEVKVMRNLAHPHIVQLYEADENGIKLKKSGEKEDVLYLVLELIKGGELFDFIALTGAFSEPVARFYFKQLISGLEYLNGLGLAHRDLKPENLLLDDAFNLKIGDFGFATSLAGRHGSGFNMTALGTKGYMAPEIIFKKPYNGTVVDLFAAAVILFVMVAQHPPFVRADTSDYFYKPLIENKPDQFWQNHAKNKPPGYFSNDFMFLISAMLSFQPEQRLSLAEVKGHPWFNGPTPSYEEVREEFARRFAKIEKDRKEKAAQKAAAKMHKASAAYTGYKAAFRSAGASEDGEAVPLELEAYTPMGAIDRRINTVFSKRTPDEIMEALAVFADEHCTGIEFGKAKAKATLRFLISDEQGVEMKARLSRCPDGMYALELRRAKGLNSDYIAKVEELVNALGDIAFEA